MTRRVHNYPVFSDGYELVGNTSTRNRFQIFLLRFPEWDALSSQVYPCLTLTLRTAPDGDFKAEPTLREPLHFE
jgi:hypothetical protein